jgi:hypothetical protein
MDDHEGKEEIAFIVSPSPLPPLQSESSFESAAFERAIDAVRNNPGLVEMTGEPSREKWVAVRGNFENKVVLIRAVLQHVAPL